MKTAVEIYKLLPKTNCGKCGLSSCFGFAAKLATNQASSDECPFIAGEAREILKEAGGSQDRSPGTVYESALASLLSAARAIDFKKTARLFGARLINDDTLEIEFLNGTYRVGRGRIQDDSGKQPKPWVSILIYNHLCMPDPPAPAGL